MAYIYIPKRSNNRRCQYNWKDLSRILTELGYQPQETKISFLLFIEITGPNEHIIKERRRIEDRIRMLDRNIIWMFRMEPILQKE